jgi:hypothetical protein
MNKAETSAKEGIRPAKDVLALFIAFGLTPYIVSMFPMRTVLKSHVRCCVLNSNGQRTRQCIVVNLSTSNGSQIPFITGHLALDRKSIDGKLSFVL